MTSLKDYLDQISDVTLRLQHFIELIQAGRSDEPEQTGFELVLLLRQLDNDLRDLSETFEDRDEYAELLAMLAAVKGTEQ